MTGMGKNVTESANNGEMIISAAIKASGRLYTGPTAVKALRIYFLDSGISKTEKDAFLKKAKTEDFEEFLTNMGRVVDRYEAYWIAHRAYQLKAGWDDPTFAADFLADAKPVGKKSQPCLDPGWVEIYAKPDPDAILDLYIEATTATPLRKIYLMSVVDAMRVLL
jgi:hypothetical protein